MEINPIEKLDHVLTYLDVSMNLRQMLNDELEENRSAYQIVTELQNLAVACVRLKNLTGKDF